MHVVIDINIQRRKEIQTEYVHGVKMSLSNTFIYLNSCVLGLGEGVREKLVPLIQGPSDTKELHTSRWLNEIRKPESLLAPDLLAFSVQVPQQGDDCRNSGTLSRHSPPSPLKFKAHFVPLLVISGGVNWILSQLFECNHCD